MGQPEALTVITIAILGSVIIVSFLFIAFPPEVDDEDEN